MRAEEWRALDALGRVWRHHRWRLPPPARSLLARTIWEARGFLLPWLSAGRPEARELPEVFKGLAEAPRAAPDLEVPQMQTVVAIVEVPEDQGSPQARRVEKIVEEPQEQSMGTKQEANTSSA